MTTGKTIALTRWTFVGKVMPLLFNMLSRLVINFLPRSKCLLISWLQSPSAVILEPPKIKSDTVSNAEKLNYSYKNMHMSDNFRKSDKSILPINRVGKSCNHTIMYMKTICHNSYILKRDSK